jgi:hypothetical protein
MASESAVLGLHLSSREQSYMYVNTSIKRYSQSMAPDGGYLTHGLILVAKIWMITFAEMNNYSKTALVFLARNTSGPLDPDRRIM